MEILGLVDVPLSVCLCSVLVVLLSVYWTWIYSTFTRQGIPGPTPWPFLGNQAGLGSSDTLEKWRRQYGNVYGIYVGREPAFVISDLAMLKQIMVKSFQNFRNRRDTKLVQYPFDHGVFFLKDASWKRVRNIITPTFSGGKLRAMCEVINESARNLTQNFIKATKSKDAVSVKDYFGAYTMDVIASTAFGIKVDSQNDFNHPFIKHAKAIFKPPRRLFLLTALNFPFLIGLLNKLKLGLFPQATLDFFVENIKEMIRQREEDPASYKMDFLKLMMDAEVTDEDSTAGVSNSNRQQSSNEKTHRRLTRDELVGQCFLFFVAGYETTASTLNFASYSMATNPDVQDKAYNEILEKLGDEEPTYDNIGKLGYLENVITETLRLYPPVIVLSRAVAETIELEGFTLKKGQTAFIPVMALQRDPNNFPDPDAFIPERHEKKNEVNPLSFLSFGYGPRICIGMRLALVEAKIALVHVLRQVKFERLPDTPDKMEFKRSNVLTPAKPNLLQVVPRLKGPRC